MPNVFASTCEKCGRTIPTEEPAAVVDGSILCRSCRDRAEPICPYCAKPMKRALPRNHGKCPECGETFFLRPDQFYFDATILTRDQKELVQALPWHQERAKSLGVTDAEIRRLWMRAREERWQPERYRTELETAAAKRICEPFPGAFDELGTAGVFATFETRGHLASLAGSSAGETEPFGIPWTRCLETARVLRRRFGRPAAARDVTWACLVDRAANPADLNDLHRLKWTQAMFLRDEGSDARHILREVARTDCRRFREAAVKYVEVLVCGGCPAAAQLGGRRFPIDEAIANPPIPCDGCTATYDDEEHGAVPWCDCEVSPVM